MGTEKFIAFKEDGSAYRLKGRILRFLDNEPVSEADKTNIRSTLSVPASGEGLTPANNLSDLSNVATARTNLSVNSKDEDAQANALKTTSPALYFNGTSSVVTVAYDSKLSFTNGSSDQPFSAGGWVKKAASDQVYLVSKRDDVLREYLFQVAANGSIYLELFDGSNNTAYAYTAAGTVADEEWTHVAFTFSAASAVSSAANDITIYKNGVAQPVTTYNAGGYTGMTDNSKPLWIQKAGSSIFGKGQIRGVKIFNRSLTASEVAELARGNDLGFSEEWGGANGGVYISDFSAGVDGWVAFSSTGTVAGNVDGIGGEDDTLRFTLNTNAGVHAASISSVTTAGKRYRVNASVYVPSTNSNVDGLSIRSGGGSTAEFVNLDNITQDSWQNVSGELVAVDDEIRIYTKEGASSSQTDAGGDDVFYIKNVTVTEIGTLADFRSERYDTSTNKLYDLSDNAFVGTGTSVTLTGREVPVYETGTWTGVYEPTTGSFATMTMDTDLIYTRIGNLVTITGSIQTDNVDTTGGSGSLKITGLPFFAAKVSTCQIGFAWNWGTNFPLNAIVSGSTIYLYTRSSTTARTDDILVTDLSTGAVANRNTLYISATYKIQ
jgi:hypothetical protein